MEIDPNFDPTEFRPRENCDEAVNQQGKNLVNFLIGKNMRILNSRTSGDSVGNLTTFKNGNTSVNDYDIVSDN